MGDPLFSGQEMEDRAPILFRRAYLAATYILAAMLGARAALVEPGGALDLAFQLVLAGTVTLSCLTDSQIRRKEMPHAAKWLTFLLWPVAVPIYLVWSRGAKGLLLILVHALAFAIVAAGAFLIAEKLAFG